MNILVRLTFYGLLLGPVASAWAGGPPFTPRLEARSELDASIVIDEEFSAADAPATIAQTITRGMNSAAAEFDRLRVFATQDAGPAPIRNFAGATAEDTLTITPVGAPTGTTRLEMFWRVEGSNSAGSLRTSIESDFRTDALGFPGTTAGSVRFFSSAVVDQTVTFVYDGVPLGAPFNYRTRMSAVISDAGAATADFDGTATFLGHRLFVDGAPTEATVAGLSGQVYRAIPEPASVALLACGALALRTRRDYRESDRD